MSIDSHGYDLIAAYGQHLGAGEPFIQALCNQARTRRAPSTAVCEKGGRWVTAEEITDPQLRQALGLATVAGASVDSATLEYQEVDAGCDRQVFTVSLPAPHEQVIGQVVRYLDGSGPAGVTAWSAFPIGRNTALAGRFASLGSAAKALAELVPANAVYYRNGWVTAERITRPATRFGHGLPILTPEQFSNAEALLINDAAHLILPTPEQVAAMDMGQWLPAAGQPVVVTHATVYWLNANTNDPNPLSRACEECGSEAGERCTVLCTAPISARDNSCLMYAPVTKAGRVDWDSAGEVALGEIDDDVQEESEQAWDLLLSGAKTDTLVPGSVRLGEAELRVWEIGEVGNGASKRYVVEVYGTNIAVEQLEDGTTLVMVDADGADAAMCVEVDGHEVSA
jgi:hypothetical protein